VQHQNTKQKRCAPDSVVWLIANVILNNKLERIGKEELLTYFKVLSEHLREGCEKNHAK
jgi:hypothetical protein